MTTFELGDGKQVIAGNGHLKTFANRGWLGVALTPEQELEIGWAMCASAIRRKRRSSRVQSRESDVQR